MKRLAWGLGAAAVIATAVFVLLAYPPDPTGNATGRKKGGPTDGAVALWSELSRFEDSHLQAFSGAFEEGPSDTLEVLNATNELMCSITGHGGLWRKTVPNQFFGCDNDADSPICARFARLEAKLGEWDRLQEQLLSLESEKAARRFMKKNGDKLRAYIATFVPEATSFSAVQATPFFEAELASALTAGP